jgi:hypothetical protein
MIHLLPLAVDRYRIGAYRIVGFGSDATPKPSPVLLTLVGSSRCANLTDNAPCGEVEATGDPDRIVGNPDSGVAVRRPLVRSGLRHQEPGLALLVQWLGSRQRSSYDGLRPVAQIQFLPDRCMVATPVNPACVRRSRCSASLRNAAPSSGMTIPSRKRKGPPRVRFGNQGERPAGFEDSHDLAHVDRQIGPVVMRLHGRD